MHLTSPLAHHIRTSSSQTFKAACKIQARHRWCLTGTPIQNSLHDYGSLLSFVGVQPFTNKAAFNFWITEPIKQNRPNSLQKLEDLVRATCLRRKKTLNNCSLKLPQQSEKVQLVELSPEDRGLYTFFKLKTAKIASKLSRRYHGAGKADQRKDANILTLINFLRAICDHGEHLLPPSALKAWKSRKDGSIDWQMMSLCRARCDGCGIFIKEVDAGELVDLEYQCQHSICAECAIRSQEQEAGNDLACLEYRGIVTNEEDCTIPQLTQAFVRPSAKVEALIQNLCQERFGQGKDDQNLPRKRYSGSMSFSKIISLTWK